MLCPSNVATVLILVSRKILKLFIYWEWFSILRSIGVPAKGRKEDLLSALKNFMDNNMCGIAFTVLYCFLRRGGNGFLFCFYFVPL